jgi:hypothetical protein
MADIDKKLLETKTSINKVKAEEEKLK